MGRDRYRVLWLHCISQTNHGLHLQALNQELEERFWQLSLAGQTYP